MRQRILLEDWNLFQNNQMEILELENTMTETKNSTDSFKSRLTTDENTISELGDKSVENSQMNQREKYRNFRKQHKRHVGQSELQTNVIRVPEEKQRDGRSNV